MNQQPGAAAGPHLCSQRTHLAAVRAVTPLCEHPADDNRSFLRRERRRVIGLSNATVATEAITCLMAERNGRQVKTAGTQIGLRRDGASIAACPPSVA
jgi:hypothetical protein